MIFIVDLQLGDYKKIKMPHKQIAKLFVLFFLLRLRQANNILMIHKSRLFNVGVKSLKKYKNCLIASLMCA